MKGLEKTYPAWFRTNYRLVINSLTDESVGHFKVTLFAMMAGVSMLLFIACSMLRTFCSLARQCVKRRL